MARPPSPPTTPQPTIITLDDSTSEISSTPSSRGARRRRRNRNNNANNTNPGNGRLKAPNVITRTSESKPVRLQLGLNLDVELELKARLQGDVTITLLAEKKPVSRPSEEVVLNRCNTAVHPVPSSSSSSKTYPESLPIKLKSITIPGTNTNPIFNDDDYDATPSEFKESSFTASKETELFHIRLGTFRLRRRWLDRDVSGSLTASVVVALVVGGWIMGFLSAVWVGAFPLPLAF